MTDVIPVWGIAKNGCVVREVSAERPRDRAAEIGNDRGADSRSGSGGAVEQFGAGVIDRRGDVIVFEDAQPAQKSAVPYTEL